MSKQEFVFDTYALLEIIQGNQNYDKYIDTKIIITEFILAELCFRLIREVGVERAFSYVDKFSSFVVAVDKEVIKKAMVYRFQNLKKEVSITDCIGYFLAKSLGIKFLTGDKEFKNLHDVEFVSKD